MDQFVVENLDKFKTLVLRYKPKPFDSKAEANNNPNPDIVVAARVRPLLNEEGQEDSSLQAIICRDRQDGVLDAHELRKRPQGGIALNSFNFRVNKSFDQDVSTESIYETLVKPLVRWAWGGGIGTLFAYGQTGSGKTYTISHLEQQIAKELMDGECGDGTRNIYMAVFELAGNSAFDLLNDRKKFSILEDSFGVTQLAGALEIHVQTTQDILHHIERATSFRRTAPTQKNDTSSRSHAICRFRIENPAKLDSDDGILYCVDLAGSEAARDRTEHGAERMKEAREINRSLSVLKDCIRGRAEADAMMAANLMKKKAHVPFRQSALTRVLKHVFDPTSMRGCKTVVVACVNPGPLDVGASKNTLRYAEMLRVLQPKSKASSYDPKVPMTWNNAQLRAWIDENSGTPSINSSILAPSESGLQLLRMALPTFEARCLQTDGVLPEQAQAFWSKLWQKHVDSQHTSSSKSKTDRTTDKSNHDNEKCSSSKDPNPNAEGVPFKERLRPGMVVSWTPTENCAVKLPGGMNLAVVLSPAAAIGAELTNVMLAENSDDVKKAGKWLCAMVLPGIAPMSYCIDMWRHLAIDVSWMDAEVVLEFDEATRFYYIKV